MKYHKERLAKLIREELSNQIARDLEFPNALVTLTEIQFDANIERADINVTVWPSEKAKDTLKVLNQAAPALQSVLFKKMKVRSLPKFVFVLDRGPENAAKVEKALLSE